MCNNSSEMESRKKSECHLSEIFIVLEVNDRTMPIGMTKKHVEVERGAILSTRTENTANRSKEVIVVASLFWNDNFFELI